MRVETEAGYGAFSIRNTFILASEPTTEDAPVKVASSETSITVSWTLTSNGGAIITGYKLYQTNVTTGGEYLVYDGTNIPTVSSHQINKLEPGNEYMYRVTASNRVGDSIPSPFSEIMMAAKVPGRPEAPEF